MSSGDGIIGGSSGGNGGHFKGSGEDGHSAHPHIPEKAISPRTLFKVLAGVTMLGVVTTSVIHSLPSIAASSKELACSWWPSPKPSTNSTFSVLIASNIPEGQRQQFQTTLATQFKQKGGAIVDFQSTCRPLTGMEALKEVKQSSYQAVMLVEVSGHQNNRKLRATVITKQGNTVLPEKDYELDETFGSPEFAQFLAEQLLLAPYFPIADEWEQKLQKTTDKQIERSSAADKRADEISQRVAIPALQGSCKAQRLSADAYLFARRPEEARQRLEKAVPACSKDPKAAAGLLIRLVVVEIESARNTSNSTAHRAFYDTALSTVDQLWILPEDLREEYSGIAIALAWQVRPKNLTAMDLRKFKERSAEAQKYAKTIKNGLYVTLQQQEKDIISPLLSEHESKETALATQIRENAEAEQKRIDENTERTKAEVAADVWRTAEQLAAEQKSRADKHAADLAAQITQTNAELAAKKAEAEKLISEAEAQRDKAVSERDQTLAELYRRIKQDETKKIGDKKKKPQAARPEQRFGCKIVITKNGRQVDVRPCPPSVRAATR